MMKKFAGYLCGITPLPPQRSGLKVGSRAKKAKRSGWRWRSTLRR